MTPNRVNRVHWPTQENSIFFVCCVRCFRSMEEIAWDGPQWGQEDFFPTNPDLADILSRTEFNFDMCFLLNFGSRISGCSDLQISTFPNFQVSRSVTKFPDFQTPRFPNAARGKTLRSQPDPSPKAPRDQICRKEPWLRYPDPDPFVSHAKA